MTTITLTGSIKLFSLIALIEKLMITPLDQRSNRKRKQSARDLSTVDSKYESDFGVLFYPVVGNILLVRGNSFNFHTSQFKREKCCWRDSACHRSR